MRLFFLIGFIFLSSCSTQTFIMRKGAGVKVQDKFSHFFISGLWQEDEIYPAKICNGVENVVKAQTKTTFANGLLAGLTLGIYTPRQKIVYCRP